jgi:RimJ/RimL family protein N-acetyltransferase
MPDASHYSSAERLRDGTALVIRALRPKDRDELVASFGRLSPRSLYRRFFGPKRSFTAKEISYFVDIDFARHVALVAEASERRRPTIVGSARYIVIGPGEAEVAFTVADAWQGRGIGTLLLRHLTQLAHGAGIRTFVADVLPENSSMLRVFEKSGMVMRRKHNTGCVQVSLQVA